MDGGIAPGTQRDGKGRGGVDVYKRQVLSPEGFASILWKDSSRSGEACEIMKLTAQDLYKRCV